MAHNILEKMVYSYKQPMWHGITEPSTVEMGAIEILDEKFDGGFEIFLRPVTVELNGEKQETGDFAIVRGKTKNNGEVLFGFCTDRYQPLQPRNVASIFDESLNTPVETMGFLGNGNDMFISWKMPTFEVVSGDEMQLYGIVRTGFDTLKGTSLFTSTYRPVCQNTINLAEGWAKQNTDNAGKGNIWKGKGVNKNLARDLGYWMRFVKDNSEKEVSLVKDFFGKLAKRPVKNDAEVVEILYRAYPPSDKVSTYYPPELRTEKEESIQMFNENQEKIRDGIFGLFAGKGTAITPDYYGVMNSTSEYFCHYQPSKKPIAQSVMFGNRQKQIMNVINVMNDRL